MDTERVLAYDVAKSRDGSVCLFSDVEGKPIHETNVTDRRIPKAKQVEVAGMFLVFDGITGEPLSDNDSEALAEALVCDLAADGKSLMKFAVGVMHRGHWTFPVDLAPTLAADGVGAVRAYSVGFINPPRFGLGGLVVRMSMPRQNLTPNREYKARCLLLLGVVR